MAFIILVYGSSIAAVISNDSVSVNSDMASILGLKILLAYQTKSVESLKNRFELLLL